MFKKPAMHIGVGINYRPQIEKDIYKNLTEIDFLEINTERFFHEMKSEYVSRFFENKPIVLHGLSLSIGNSDEIKETYLKNLSDTLKSIAPLWFSEHIALTKEKDVELRGLMPVAFTEDNIDRIVTKTQQITDLSSIPFLLENITYYYPIPGSNIPEYEFISTILEKANCGMLLDVNNLFTNAYNHQYDPYEFLEKIPLDRVVEIHLAGGAYIRNLLVDTHASSIKKEVFDLFEHVCKKTKFNGVIIERDAKLERFSDLLEEIRIVRNIMKKAGLHKTNYFHT